MAICPTGAIKISGRELSDEDLFTLPEHKDAADFNQVFKLFQRRRSIREFTPRDVPLEIIEKIVEAARTVPMGLPPSDVNLLILQNRKAVRNFSYDFCEHLKGIRWIVSNWFLGMMRPFLGKTNHELFRDFVRPMFEVYISNMEKGVDLVTYDAPLAMYFYGSPYSDPADPIVAATAAMYAGEALGLGTCMLGGVHPLIQNGKKAMQFRKKYNIKYKSREGLIVIFGYPDVKYRKGIRRSFASETVFN
jgi:nitroreductase